MSTLKINNIQNLGGTVETYRYVQTLYYTSSGTFVKADYPWLNAIRVKVQGAGGGGGGVDASVTGTGAGGGAGAYAEGFVTDIAGLASSVSVTVGSGGAGSANNAAGGSAGGQSSFGTLVVAIGGYPASLKGISGPVSVASGTDLDFKVEGPAGAPGALSLHYPGGVGASSFLGGGGNGARAFSGVSVLNVGDDAGLYGGGGGGASHTSADANDRAGGDGSNGIVIVELYA